MMATNSIRSIESTMRSASCMLSSGSVTTAFSEQNARSCENTIAAALLTAMLAVPQLFDPTHAAWSLFSGVESPWEAVIRLPEILGRLAARSNGTIHPEATISPGAIVRNSYIGAGVEVYEGCVVRDSIILEDTVVGHCSEVARSIILPRCMIPRFNYVGSSLLGESVRLGGSTMLSSHRHDWKPLTLRIGDLRVDLGITKFGALLGDGAHLAYGCHTNPATVVGARTVVMPLTDVTGFVPPDSTVISKRRNVILSHRFRRG